ncbi:NUDIX domain-containing protein [Planomicrobium sp. YIM 101495]|uniref:NUDIX domain-containing protein n=1 Tax=Planomicrobium sp. YIM 101495 TaxID=2665160 RepID=UPI0012B6C10C|nr:NUDIX hydrolase [Planomicrobium sp. YIM 101495]MTD30104.1 NUDIX domain-containing protein [Planomicrobium sp. YIM 101495]
MKKFEERTIHSERLYEGKIINLKVDDVELPNGKQGKRELIEHPGAVAVIALTDEGKLIMVEQFRKALERSIIEIPAGKLEPGEAPETTAKRELEEETGYRAADWKHIQTFSTSPGFADEIIHLYEATGLERVEQPALLDEDEFVELMEVTIEEAEEMMKDERIYDAKTAFAVLWAKMTTS